MPKIVVATINARYIHTSLGLRYLYANMGELQQQTELAEFTLEQRPIDIAERLLAGTPSIIGLGVYIWNCEQSTQLVSLLKEISPETVLVIGGPEVSHEWQGRRITDQADYLITGPADLSFAALCRDLLDGKAPSERMIQTSPPSLDSLASPYPFYSDHDIAHRLIYVEASRGCPFRCEFCLSALDRTAWMFELEPFLAEMDRLLLRGARHFKFVDRTFNLKLEHSLAILDFFLERMQPGLFLHFEVIPDRLPQQLKSRLRRFPEGSLQLEIGVQTFDPQVAERISRKQDHRQTRQNLDWLRRQTNAHLHTDLIIGLPGEGVESFAAGFNELVALAPHEIQVGVLKRLRGTPIVRHTDAYRMRFNPDPPYQVLATDRIDFTSMQRLQRFSRYWDLIGNSGRFRQTLPVLLGDSPFQRFMQLSDWLFASTGQVHRISLKRLFELLYQVMVTELQSDPRSTAGLLVADYAESGCKGLPAFLREPVTSSDAAATEGRHNSRQLRHRSQ